jgi:hypothetical protein
MAAKRTASQRGLGAAARRLWDVTLERFELSAHEQIMLREICKTIDIIEDLTKIVEAEGVVQQKTFRDIAVHPVLTQLRAQRLCLSKLVKDLRLPLGLEPERAILPARRTRFQTQLKAVAPDA